jgi:hypothetical protein
MTKKHLVMEIVEKEEITCREIRGTRRMFKSAELALIMFLLNVSAIWTGASPKCRA